MKVMKDLFERVIAIFQHAHVTPVINFALICHVHKKWNANITVFVNYRKSWHTANASHNHFGWMMNNAVATADHCIQTLTSL